MTTADHDVTTVVLAQHEDVTRRLARVANAPAPNAVTNLRRSQHC